MNTKALKTLEYNKIIDRLTELASCEGGKNLCRTLEPQMDLSVIDSMQNETSDALSRIFKKGSLSFSGVRDIRGSLKRLAVGGILSILELLHICMLLETTNHAKAYARKENADTTDDSLDPFFEMLMPLSPLANEIRRCIISEEEISDDASSTLRHIRKSIASTNDRIHSQMNTMVNSGSMRTYLQDNVVTMRNDRYCLPVKAEYRGQVQGMIHDQSSTGSTLFIEPMAVVKLNNDLKELYIKEQKEIEIIISTLSASAAEHTEELSVSYEILTKLDFIFARGLLAKDLNASRPVFNSDGIIRLRNARHPLLQTKKVVPISLQLGESFDLLIVTGPNTGGKTVSLKTVGLLTLMGQAGLHIPAGDRSELSVFTEVYADIGDEQSIEQNLSTFSSHMTNIVHILEKADYQSLVLFDELCAGTDPTEGAALAISILSYLHERGIRTMATTHYSEIKLFALSTDGVENACCEFDLETLSPTYRLLIGIPGKSNAFAISRKIGLSEELIDNARKHLTTQDESFEDLLANLEANRKTIEKEQLEIQTYKEEIKQLKQRMEQKEEKIDNRRENLLREASEEAHALLAEAKAYADQTIRDFNKFGKDNISAHEMEEKRSELRRKMSEVEKHMAMKPAGAGRKQHKPKDFKIGDTVRIHSMNITGSITALPDAKDNVMVQMGILSSSLPISDLEIIPEQSAKMKLNNPKTSTGKLKMSKSAAISPEINLLGKTVDEAIAELDKYLDDAYLSHLEQVRIVHGKGTGALRKGVHTYLRRQKHVKSFRLGEFGEGDAGVTIVEFK